MGLGKYLEQLLPNCDWFALVANQFSALNGLYQTRSSSSEPRRTYIGSSAILRFELEHLLHPEPNHHSAFAMHTCMSETRAYRN